MSTHDELVIGVDSCPLGWFAAVLDGDDVSLESYTEFRELKKTYSGADQILVDIPIGLPENESVKVANCHAAGQYVYFRHHLDRLLTRLHYRNVLTSRSTNWPSIGPFRTESARSEGNGGR